MERRSKDIQERGRKIGTKIKKIKKENEKKENEKKEKIRRKKE